MKPFIQSLLIVACLVAATASGATKYVAPAPAGTNNPVGGAIDSPWKDITFALTNVVAGDIINVSAGTYNPASGETFPLFLPDQISLIGADRATTILDAGDTERVITATNCTTSGLIARFTIQEGLSKTNITPHGGGILGTNGLTVSNCIVRANSTPNPGKGGGIHRASLVTECTIENNYAYLGGGGLHDIGIISGCIIRMNTAYTSGGGGGVLKASVIEDSLIEKNRVSFGSGLGVHTVGLISGCVIKHNSSSTTPIGGGIYDATTVSNCQFIGNDATTGAGLYDPNGANVFNCLFAGNSARGDGGAIYMLGGKIRNCTIVGNIGYRGGGLYLNTSTIVSNSIVWNNSDDLIGHSNTKVVYSIISDSDGDSTCTHSDPLLVGGYFLDDGSPAIDAGAGTVAGLGLTDKVVKTNGTEDTGTVDIGFHYPAGSTGSRANRYVRTDGNNGNTGTSNTSGGAWRTITYALSQAQSGWTVHVGAGTYNMASGEVFTNALSGTGGLLIPDAVALIGDAGPTNTIIDANGSNRRVLFGPVTATVAGFTIQNGKHGVAVTSGLFFYGGGGIRGHGVVVSNCIVQGNYAQDGASPEGAGGLGGGISGCRLVTDNTIINNNATCGGGGIDGCIQVTGNIVLANRGNCSGAGGIIARGGTIENNVVAGNFALSAEDGGCIGGISYGGPTLLKNNTIAYNRGNRAGGVGASGVSTPIRNCILWGNRGFGFATSTNDITGGNNTVITYSDIEDTFWGSTGCIHTNPLFHAPMGTSAALTSTQLTDGSANWQPDSLIGAYLNPNTNNNTMPLVFRITDNDATTITCAGGGLTANAGAGQNYRVEDYHEKSIGGRYTYGLAYVEIDPYNDLSPCIDAGNPSDPYLLESAHPVSRGVAINMGAFGNTAQASLIMIPLPPGTMIIIR